MRDPEVGLLTSSKKKGRGRKVIRPSPEISVTLSHVPLPKFYIIFALSICDLVVPRGARVVLRVEDLTEGEADPSIQLWKVIVHVEERLSSNETVLGLPTLLLVTPSPVF